MDDTLEKWIETHPFLLPIAQVQELIARAASRPGGGPELPPPPDAYAQEHAGGVPLLHSESWRPELGPAVDALDRVVAALAEPHAGVANGLHREVQQLRARFEADPGRRLAALQWLVQGGAPERAPEQAGLVRFLGWAALRAALEPALAAYDRWRGDGQAWMRGYCPACGAQPSVARLSPGEMMRQRSMICSHCASEWRFRRIGCPHCGNDDSGRLSALEIEGEGALRIDGCEECKGYVKTYTGDEPRPAALADWTTLHVDMIAQEQGYRRLGASFVEV